MFTLPDDLLAELDRVSAATGEKKSRIVERGLRLAFGQPAPAQVEAAEPALAMTRSEHVVLYELEKLGSGWHTEHEIAKASGLTPHVARKSLLALARGGKAHEWGPGRLRVDSGRRLSGPEIRLNEAEAYYPDAEHGRTCWGIESPTTALDLVLADFRAGKLTHGEAFQRVEHMALAVADVEPFRKAAHAVLWPTLTYRSPGALQNFAEREREAVEAYEAEQRASDEAAARVLAAQWDRARREEEENERLDAEFALAGTA